MGRFFTEWVEHNNIPKDHGWPETWDDSEGDCYTFGPGDIITGSLCIPIMKLSTFKFFNNGIITDPLTLQDEESAMGVFFFMTDFAEKDENGELTVYNNDKNPGWWIASVYYNLFFRIE